MTAETTLTGATSRQTIDWHTINWKKVHREVRRLQARIVKAVRAGKWGKVKSLQRLLTRSFSGRALAVRRVTENRGKKTAGVDGELWDTPAKKGRAVERLRQRGYRAQPLRRVYIPKSGQSTKKRGLNIPTMLDRAMQTLYRFALEPIVETMADPNSYGFRKERSPADAIEQCFKCLGQKHSAQWILDADIRACFDEISHQWLLDHIPIEKWILKQWLKAGYIEQDQFYPTEAGTAQGGTISPTVANYALDGLERTLKEHFPRTSKPNPKVHLIRFADDIVITGRSKDLLEKEVKPVVTQFLQERGLTLSPRKTKIVHINQGFDFLGQNIRTYNNKLLIKPAKKSVKALLTNVRYTLNKNKQAPAGQMVMKLNPIIRGWVNYHRHVVSKATFVQVDNQIFKAVWQWAKRRHPNKSRKWIRRKYFRTRNNFSWTFFGQKPGGSENPPLVHLFRASQTPIKRHIKVKAAANPYDPDWELYFEKRLDTKMKQNLQGRKRLLSLWQSQNGLCPVCDQKITQDTGWHRHHLTPRTKGGDDRLTNLVLLHPNCHRQVHNQRLTVTKPRP